MKKILKKLFVGISATTVLTMNFLTVSAVSFAIDDYPAYKKYVEANYERFPKEKEEELLKNDSTISDVFYSFDNTEDVYYVYTVMAFNNECYEYSYSMIYWKDFYRLSNETELPSEKEINTFLSENNLKAKVDAYQPTEYVYHPNDVVLEYDENITFDEVQAVIDSLESEFGLYVKGIHPCSFTYLEKFNNEPTIEEKNPSVSFGAPTIAGDLDNDSTPGLTDVVKLTKYNANSELYPLADTTALANADVNKDGTIDALDTNILIEMVLGSYESAV